LATNNYHFITHWRVQGTVKEVEEVIGNAADLVRWWPSVYLDVQILEPGDERGLGRVVSLYTKGWLPYTLRWSFRVTEVRNTGFTLVAWGDFEGRGIWTFEQDGAWVNITYDWKIAAEKPLLRYFSFIMKPLFSANHQWAMRKGEESLKLELARRHARTAEEAALVPAPPQPTLKASLPLVLGLGAAFLVVGSVLYSATRLLSKNKT
jgi:hypothetical protein